jgi:hypothetical protein
VDAHNDVSGSSGRRSSRENALLESLAESVGTLAQEWRLMNQLLRQSVEQNAVLLQMLLSKEDDSDDDERPADVYLDGSPRQ